MLNKLLTKISSSNGNEYIYHLFMPALAIKIALTQGLFIKENLINDINQILEQNLLNGNLRFDNEHPPDYDLIVVAREFLELVNKPQIKLLDFFFSEKGGLYTYLGGKESKGDNSIDLMVNTIVLAYLTKYKLNKKDANKIKKFLIKNKKKFDEDIKKISKYYLSEGFLIYCLNKVSKELGINIEKLIKIKIAKINNKTDLALVILTLDKIPKRIIEKYKNSKKEPLNLFQKPSNKDKYSCLFFDEVVRKCAEAKLQKHE